MPKKKLENIKKVGFREAFRRFRSFISNERDLLLADILFETGCTLSQALRIKHSDIDFKRGRLKLGKSEVKISYELAKRLKHTGGEYIFQTNGRIISKRRAEQIFSYYSKKSGVKITPRLLRRFYLNTLLQSSPDKAGLKTAAKPVPDLSKFEFPEKERDLLILAILYETGCKTSELVNLKVKDVKKGKIRFPGKSMYVSSPLYSKLKKFIANRENSEYLFLTKGKRITPRRVQQIIKNCSKDKITPKDFRKHFIYRQLKKGKDAEKVKRLLGIKRVEVFTHGVAEVKYEIR